MITIGSKSAINEVIQLDPNLFEGNIGYFKIAETSHLEEEGNQRTLALLCTGGGNYADNEDGPVFCNLMCTQRNYKD